MTHDPTRHTDPADCPVCVERMTREPMRLTDTQADRAGDDYFERLASVADRRFQ